uniref:HpcH/HpaI aldolase family protein n=1 Tax=Marinobacterium profundum TaxID=1714300 RepID=UPI001C1F9337|nr:aldolase/citrate lyase family protein [Marinobacterium profundum]
MSLPDSYAAEVIGHAGVDSVTVDLQHGMMGFDQMLPMLQAISSTPATPLVRVSTCEPATIMKVLDAGAYGIICPQVDNAEICRRFVSACLYPPSGNRSFGPSRGLTYGGSDYVTKSEGELLLLAMIESREALDNLDDILDVPGLSGIYIGPNDLALSMGYMPGVVITEVEQAIERVLQTALSRGLFVGIFCADECNAKKRVEQGFHLVTPGNDAGILRKSYQYYCQSLCGVQESWGQNGGY